jgi:hypothetical protein
VTSNLSGSTRGRRLHPQRPDLSPQQLITVFCTQNGICTGCRIRWADKPRRTCTHCKERMAAIWLKRKQKPEPTKDQTSTPSRLIHSQRFRPQLPDLIPQQRITAFCARNGICTGCRIRWAEKPSATCSYCKARATAIRLNRKAKKLQDDDRWRDSYEDKCESGTDEQENSMRRGLPRAEQSRQLKESGGVLTRPFGFGSENLIALCTDLCQGAPFGIELIHVHPNGLEQRTIATSRVSACSLLNGKDWTRVEPLPKNLEQVAVIVCPKHRFAIVFRV